MPYKLLIVDDDKELQKMLKNYFTIKNSSKAAVFADKQTGHTETPGFYGGRQTVTNNYEIYQAEDGKAALDKISISPDLILLDINMPRMDGLEFCRQIRSRVNCPILFLTGKVEEQDRVNGLLSGGDDYILKPFSLKELDARITAHLKREERQGGKSKLRFTNQISIDYASRSVYFGDLELEFTKTEYDIIEFLSTHAGQVFEKERIYETVCGYDAEGDSRVVTELIRRIRRKLADFTNQEVIKTVWGSGYRWEK